MLKAFWVEMRATIRSVSPFLQALLKSEGLSLNEVVAGIEPVPGWPRRPRLSAGGVAGPETRRHMFRYYLATLRTKNAQLHSIRDNAHGQTIIMANGAEARVQMIGHAIEVDLAIGETRLETRFGTLRIELEHALPDTLAAGIVGRRVDDVLDHPALRGRDWFISAVEDAAYPFVGQMLVVETGNSPYRVPDSLVG